MAFAPDGTLLMTIGERNYPQEDTGAVLRIEPVD